MHDVVIVGIPLIAIFAGILFNRADAKELRTELAALDRKIDKQGTDLRAEINHRHAEVLGRFNALDRAMNEFYHMTGKLDARMDSLEKR